MHSRKSMLAMTMASILATAGDSMPAMPRQAVRKRDLLSDEEQEEKLRKAKEKRERKAQKRVKD